MRSAFLEALTLTTESTAAESPVPRVGFWRAVWVWVRRVGVGLPFHARAR